MRAIPLLALLALAACGSANELAKPDGKVFRLNPERWAERVNDIRQEASR